MKNATASDVKNQFGRFLEASLVEPVAIHKSGRKVAVILSWAEYERLSAAEDAWWGRQAEEAEKEGFLTPKASMAVLRRRLKPK